MPHSIDIDQLTFSRISEDETIMLRKSVLWPRRSSSPPNMELAEDGKGHHFGAFIGGRVYPVAVISLWKQPEPLPEPPESSTSSDRPEEVGANSTKGVTAVRFDHFAVESEFQRHGIGSALLRHAFQVAQDSLGADVIWCTASLVAVNYYRKHEMEVCAPTLLKGPSLYFTPMRIVLSGERNDGVIRFRRVTVHQTLSLRHVVLWPDHPLSHVRLPEDDDGHHYGAFLPKQTQPAAVISLFLEPLPSVTQETDALAVSPQSKAPLACRFRKFACDPALQGRGIGTGLLKYILDVSRNELGAAVIWCDARTSSAEWYRRRGMQMFGPTFYKGPIEYVRMKTS